MTKYLWDLALYQASVLFLYVQFFNYTLALRPDLKEKKSNVRVEQTGLATIPKSLGAHRDKGILRKLFSFQEFSDPKTVSEKAANYCESEFIDYAESLVNIHDSPSPSLQELVLSKIHTISLVINHCDHPLDWLADFTRGFEDVIENVFVFTKCGHEVFGAPHGAQIVVLPNVGRCDHTYAHWLNNYFQADPNAVSMENQIVVFMKDTTHQIGEGSEHKFGDMLSLAVLNGLGCLEAQIRGLSSLVFRYDLLQEMAFLDQSYGRSSGGGNLGAHVPFHNMTLLNLGDWIAKLQISSIISTQNLVSECFGGFFAVAKTQIANQPKSVWRAMEESLSRGDNIVEGHYAERLWGCLLSKPLSNETASAVWGRNPSFEIDYWPLRGMLKL